MKNNENATKQNEITKIYLVENCYNDPNKVYIGKTKNSRLGPHKQTFGCQIIYTYIDEINSWNKKDWKPLECYWIEQFKAWGFEVINKNKGGGGSPCGIKRSKEFCNNLRKININRFISDEHKQNISKALKGKPKPQGFGIKPKGYGGKISKINSNNPKMKLPKPKLYKPILQYDLEENLIKEWSNQSEAIKKTNNKGIPANLKGITKKSGGYIWKYKLKYI